MKIFITGVTGYIGLAVASRLAARGHHVIGLVRSTEKAKIVSAVEIQPVIGTMNDPETYTEAAQQCDLLIHCAAEWSPTFHELDRKTTQHLIQIAQQSGLRRRLIYTSGVCLYGNTGNQRVNESSSLDPLPYVRPRQDTEKMVLHANDRQLSSLIIRPGCVYGGSGSLTATWFDTAYKNGQAEIIGDGHYRWAMVHIEDLADLYVRAAESYLGGEIFNATDHSRFTILECAEAASRVAGKNGQVKKIPKEEASKTLGDLAECLTLDQHIDSSKAMYLLNWHPHHTGFVDGATRYFDAWKALNSL